MNREFDYTKKDFDFLRNITNKKTGIVVSDDKFNMFYARLSKHVRRLGLKDFNGYCSYVKNCNDDEMDELINAVTTNLTSFFRESHHFDYLKNECVPSICSKKPPSQPIRIWSAGCSTGEEPYSIAIAMLECLPSGYKVNITATDIDTEVLKKAKNGVYQIKNIGGLSNSQLKKWFHKGVGDQDGYIKVKPEIQKMITFKQVNLIENIPFSDYFDAIFCRNVLIYFDKETKESIANKYSKLLDKDSCLFIGHSESLFNVTEKFKLIGNTIYRKT